MLAFAFRYKVTSAWLAGWLAVCMYVICMHVGR